MGITVEMLPAFEGDALWITIEDDGVLNVLIDGGRSKTGELLAARIKTRAPVHIDLLVVTHVDRDHVEGVIKLLELCSPEELTISDVWFNGYRHLDGSLPLSGLREQGAVMGNRLEELISVRQVPWNHSFEGHAAMCSEVLFPEHMLGKNTKITLLGPTAKELGAMLPVWERECARAGLRQDVMTSDAGESLVEQAARTNFDFQELIGVPFVDDIAPANRSSIVLLIEYRETRVLLAGDASAETLVASLGALRARRGPFAIDAFKVPHHGSAHNLSAALLEAVGCTNYLLSTNGAYFSHPSDEALARIVHHHASQALPLPALYFNYRSARTEPWCEETRQGQLGYIARAPEDGNGLAWFSEVRAP